VLSLPARQQLLPEFYYVIYYLQGPRQSTQEVEAFGSLYQASLSCCTNLINELQKAIDIKFKFVPRKKKVDFKYIKSELVENIHILIKNGTNVVPCLTEEVNVILQLFIKENYHYHKLRGQKGKN